MFDIGYILITYPDNFYQEYSYIQSFLTHPHLLRFYTSNILTLFRNILKYFVWGNALNFVHFRESFFELGIMTEYRLLLFMKHLIYNESTLPRQNKITTILPHLQKFAKFSSL